MTRQFYLLFWWCLCAASVSAQQLEDAPERIVTEEVILNVTAQNSAGRFDQTVVKDDLLVVENGVPQKIESLRRVPANVLLLLDTSSGINFVKNIVLTRLIAKDAAQTLPDDAFLAAIECSGKTEVISDWTNQKDDILTLLQTKLSGGDQARPAECLAAARKLFESRPLENRHLLLITDGADDESTSNARQQSIQSLTRANISVHVVSYSKLELQLTDGAAQRFNFRFKKRTPQRLPDWVVEPIVKALTTEEAREFYRLANRSQRILQLELDGEWLNAVRTKQKAWRESEAELSTLAGDTGGYFSAPETIESLLKIGAEIANVIASQYVVTYQPKRSVINLKQSETRQVRVVSRRVGLQVNARRKLILAAPQ